MKFEVDYNTYMTVTEADSIIADEFDSKSEEYILWSQLDNLGKQRLIINGTRLVDKLPYIGIQYPGTNSLRWPRLISSRYFECPYDIKVGILKQITRETINSYTNEYKLQELGVKSYSIKGASISFTDKEYNKISLGIYKDIYDEYFSKWVY